MSNNTDFKGDDYRPARDKDRLTKQQTLILNSTLGKGWVTIHQIHQWTGAPHQSIARQLRYIGDTNSFKKLRKHIKDGLYKYKIVQANDATSRQDLSGVGQSQKAGRDKKAMGGVPVHQE